MHKEDDKISLNMDEDFTLPNLEEGLNIDEIPTIEDLISIDEEEMEKTQEEISSKEEDYEEPSKATLEKVEQPNLENNFDAMNLFDEDIALTLDDNLSTTQETGVHIDVQNQEEEFQANEFDTLPNYQNLFDEEDNVQLIPATTENETDEILNINQDEILAETENLIGNAEVNNSEIQEEIDAHEESTEIMEVFPEDISDEVTEQAIKNTEVFLEENKTVDTDTTFNTAENFEEVISNDINKRENKPHRKTDDVFAKIDSLLNDDSAFVSSDTPNKFSSLDENLVDLPKHHYQSSFNPTKYLGQSKTSDSTNEKLGILYTAKKVIDNLKNFSEDINGENKTSVSTFLTTQNGKKAIIATAVCAFVIGAGITGISIFNNKSVEELDTLNTNDVTMPLKNPDNNLERPAQQAEPVIASQPTDVAQNIPDLTKIEQPKIEVKQDAIKSEVSKQTKQINSESYLSVKKIQWQIPDYLSYSPNIKTYLQTAGKSIKLGLSSDLLLATEYAYSNVVKINLKMSNNGNVQNANIVTSSGSKQIDDIVLQSVKSTLNVVKPPVGEVKTPDFNLTITINL